MTYMPTTNYCPECNGIMVQQLDGSYKCFCGYNRNNFWNDRTFVEYEKDEIKESKYDKKRIELTEKLKVYFKNDSVTDEYYDFCSGMIMSLLEIEDKENDLEGRY